MIDSGVMALHMKQGISQEQTVPLWRAGLPRVGLQSSPNTRHSVCLKEHRCLEGAAAQPNAVPARLPQEAFATLGLQLTSPTARYASSIAAWAYALHAASELAMLTCPSGLRARFISASLSPALSNKLLEKYA